MSVSSRCVLGAALAMVVGAALSPAAHAQTWEARDPHRDVVRTHFTVQPRPCGTTTTTPDPADRAVDIVGFAVAHDEQSVDVELAMGALGPGDRPPPYDGEVGADPGSSYHFLIAVPGRLLQVDVGYTVRSRTIHAVLDVVRPLKHPQHLGCGVVVHDLYLPGPQCDGLRADVHYGRDQVTVSVPRACLGTPPWVRVGAFAVRQFVGPSEVTLHLDRWLPPGAHGRSLRSLLGPRLLVG